MKSAEQDQITDEMIGTDDKICRCSSVIADMISSSESRQSGKLRKLIHTVAQKDIQTAGTNSDKIK